MGGDISDGAKIGIGLVLLVAIVAIVMALLKMIKNQTNKGSTSLQDSFDKVSESEFDGYDQVEKTGTDVKAAVKIFQDRPVAIVVQTTKDQAAGTKAWNYGALLKGVTASADTTANVGNVAEVTKLDPDDTTGATAYTAGNLVPWTGHSGLLGELEITAATGAYVYNNNYAPMDKTSTTYFVRSSGRFMSYLIKSDAGENIGVAFVQTK